MGLGTPKLFSRLALSLRTCIWLGVGIIAAVPQSQAKADPLDNWQVRRQLGTSAAIAYGNERFVVITYGYVPQSLVSTNGTDWKAYILPEASQLVSLTFANGNFLVVLSRSYNPDSGMALYSSTNGIFWTLRNFQPNNPPYSWPISRAGGGNGIYVFAAANFIMSTNLVNWTTVEQGATGITEFTFGDGVLVGAPYGGSAFVASTDGLVWEYIPCPGGLRFTSVRYANGRFAAFAPAASDASSPPASAMSLDAENWSATVLPDFTNSTRLVSANDKFFLLNTVSNGFFASTDALTWESRSFGTNVQITDLTFGANTYVAVGDAILQSGRVTNPPAPSVLAIQTYPGVTINGTPGQHYRIEYTENLANTNRYQPLTNVLLTTSPFLWVDTTATNAARRFYRAVQMP